MLSISEVKTFKIHLPLVEQSITRNYPREMIAYFHKWLGVVVFVRVLFLIVQNQTV